MRNRILLGIAAAVSCQAQPAVAAPQPITIADPNKPVVGHLRVIHKSCDTVWSAIGPWAIEDAKIVLVNSDRQMGIATFRREPNGGTVALSIESINKANCSVHLTIALNTLERSLQDVRGVYARFENIYLAEIEARVTGSRPIKDVYEEITATQHTDTAPVTTKEVTPKRATVANQ